MEQEAAPDSLHPPSALTPPSVRRQSTPPPAQLLYPQRRETIGECLWLLEHDPPPDPAVERMAVIFKFKLAAIKNLK